MGRTFIFILLFPLCLNAQTERGTLIVFGVSQSKIIVAGDSRGLGRSSTPDDNVCKIIALGPKLLFTEAGIGAEVHTVLTSKNWSASKEASKSFSKFAGSKFKNDEETIKKISADWAKNMVFIYTRMLNTDPMNSEQAEGNVLMNAVFIGVDAEGQFVAREIGMTFKRNESKQKGSFVVSATNSSWTFSPNMVFKTSGHGEIASEFSIQSSVRSRADALQFQARAAHRPLEDPDVLRAVHLVEVTESFAPADWGVGGAIDVAEILPGSEVRWLKRKPNCVDAAAKSRH